MKLQSYTFFIELAAFSQLILTKSHDTASRRRTAFPFLHPSAAAPPQADHGKGQNRAAAKKSPHSLCPFEEKD